MSAVEGSVNFSRNNFLISPLMIPGKKEADEIFNRVNNSICSPKILSPKPRFGITRFERSANGVVHKLFEEARKISFLSNNYLIEDAFEEGFIDQELSLGYDTDESVTSNAPDLDSEHAQESLDDDSLPLFIQQEYSSPSTSDMQELGAEPNGEVSNPNLNHRRSFSLPVMPTSSSNSKSESVEEKFQEIEKKYLEIKNAVLSLVPPRECVSAAVTPIECDRTPILRRTLSLTEPKRYVNKNIHELFEELLINVSELIKSKSDIEKYKKTRDYLQEIYELDFQKYFLDQFDLIDLNDSLVDLDSIICMLQGSGGSPYYCDHLSESGTDFLATNSEDSDSTLNECRELTSDTILYEMALVENNGNINEITGLLNIFEKIKQDNAKDLDDEILDSLNSAISDLKRLLK